ncbi:TlpA family protein disulfide reductase [Tenacibaculum sp. ZS6-P6]|uniref:TlpA family protein disulfide reductase n=1 Tax=Tenacibaculum sp. ZS6-P6 TaxID=3447503 RepID=UPI003F9582EB
MKKVITFLIVLASIFTIQAQEYSFIPKGLKELSFEKLMEKGPPSNLELVFYEDGTKTTLDEVIPLIMSGAVYPRMFVDKKGKYKALVIIGGRYSFLPTGLKPISMDELKRRGVPKYLELVYLEDGTKVPFEEGVNLIKEGKAMPQMFVDKNEVYKALVVLKYKNDIDPYADIKNPTGEQAKPFTIKSINGEKYSLQNLKGKVIVLNFWFIDCMPCREEMPDLNKLEKKYRNNKNVVFLGIALDNKNAIKEFIKDYKFTYNLVSNGTKLSELYEVSVYPTHYVIDKKSKISYFSIGSGNKVITGIDSAIQKSLN